MWLYVELASMSPREWITLLGVGLENRFYNFRLGWQELARFWSLAWWWRLKLARGLTYLAANPFRLSRQEGRQTELSENDLIFGETPFSTCYRLLEKVEASPADRVVELGCGRANLLFVSALAFGCRGTGVEVLDGFVERGRALALSLSLENELEFVKADFRLENLPVGQIYFLSPTTLETESWRLLQDRMLEAPPGARAIVLSTPLPRLGWKTVERLTLPYSWGDTVTFLQERL